MPKISFFCHFLKLGPLVFLEIAYNDSLQQYLTFSSRKICVQNFGQMDQNPTQNQVFCNFLKFGSLVFLEIRYNDRLQQCSKSSRGATYRKKFGERIWGKMGQNQAQNQVFCHFLKFGSLDFLEIAYTDTLQQCITSSRAKTYQIIFRKQIWCKTSQNLAQNQVFGFFLKFNFFFVSFS